MPTVVVTPGVGQTLQALPAVGQTNMAGGLPVTFASDQSVIPVTALNTGAIANPASILTRPATTVSATATATSATPAVFTLTGFAPINGTTLLLGGSVAPTGGNFTLGNVYYVVGASGSTCNLALTFGGAALSSTSTGTSLTLAIVYVTGSLIASNVSAGSVVVPTFASGSAGLLVSSLRLVTNATAGWNNATMSMDLWSGAPTFSSGDAGPYVIATGAAGWLATFQGGLVQWGDGAVGRLVLTGAGQAAFKFGAPQNVSWTLQAMSQASPIASQTFIPTFETIG